jgi:hypothetical protein
MTQETQTPNEPQTTTEPEYIPHDPGMENFDDATMESEVEQSTTEPDTTGNNEPEGDPDNPDNESDNVDPDDNQPGVKGNVFKFDDQEIEPGEPHVETEREKALREENEQLRKQQQSQHPAELADLKEPELYEPGIDGDPQKYQVAMREYALELGKREAKAEIEQEQQAAQRKVDHDRFNQNVALYGQRIAQVKDTLPDIGQADDMLGRELPQMHQTAIFSAGVDNPEMVAYALYKNKALRDQFTQEQNPFRLGMMVADISKRAQLAPKAPAKPLNKEPKPKGSQGAHPNKYGLTGDLADAVVE